MLNSKYATATFVKSNMKVSLRPAFATKSLCIENTLKFIYFMTVIFTLSLLKVPKTSSSLMWVTGSDK